MGTAAVVSYRLGGPDGVSVEAAKWISALGDLGLVVTTVAGAGQADVVLPGLAADAGHGPDPASLARALRGADIVVVENVCSLPLNPAAGEAVARGLRGRPAILHHHDLPWQRERFAGMPGWPPDEPHWAHVTINDLSRRQMEERGFTATTIRNCFDVDVPPGDRCGTRAALEVEPGERLILHPTRAIPRKNVPAAVALAEALGASYWLLGPAEDGYGLELDGILARADCRVIRGQPDGCSIADCYAAADAVTLPSTWEGFGNATVESAVHRRPLAIGDYPVARELAAYGFRWFNAGHCVQATQAGDPDALAAWLERPDPSLLDHNQEIARTHFSMATLRQALARLLARG